jgi:hypothetical protein
MKSSWSPSRNRLLPRLALALLAASAASATQEAPFFPPGAPTARNVDVVDVLDAPLDTAMTMSTLQGLVNRGDSASLYLITGEWDRFWLKHLLEAKYIERVEVLRPEEAVRRHAGLIRRIFVYDPAVPATINIATMLASLENGVVAAADTVAEWGMDAEVEDLRGRWPGDAAAYAWAFENLWPRMNTRLLAVYHPVACRHRLRDYLVAHRVFTIWVTAEDQPGHAEQKAVLLNLLAASAPNIPVIGFWYSGADRGLDEYTGVGLAGEYGKITVVADHSSNLSLLSGVPADTEAAVRAYRQRLATPPETVDPGAVYLCIDIVESGDAPVYLQAVQHTVWAEPERGALPINWSMGPAIFDLAPPIAAYYYANATPNDYLYTAISGSGYTHPYRDFMSKTDNPEHNWAAYLAMTRRAMQRMASAELALYTDAWKPFVRTLHDPTTRRFVDAIPELDLLVLGMGRDDGIGPENGNYLLDGTLVTHVLTRWPTDYAARSKTENIDWLAEAIREQTPDTRPAFMNVMALSWAYTPSGLAALRDALGPGYTLVTLPVFSRLYRAHLREQEVNP